MKKKGFIRIIICVTAALALVLASIAVVPAISPKSVETQAATISKQKLTLYVKQTATLKVKGAKTKVTWTSSNKKVATVTSAGKVTGIKKGTATITAKTGGKKYTCKVTVKNPTLSPTKVSLSVGKTTALKVKNAVGTVKWVSGNEAVATVNKKGVVKAVSEGTAIITATASGVKLTCKVTVTQPAIAACLATEPFSLDPAYVSTTDEATMVVHLFSGLARYDINANGSPDLVPDMAEAFPAPVDNGNGTFTYTYKIREDAKWSDGKAVTADDFVFAWNRAAFMEDNDFSYLFEAIDGFEKGNLNVRAVDANTLVVTTNGKLYYWNQLLAYPILFPVREDVVSNANWAKEAFTYVSNGMYTMDSWSHDALITLKKNAGHPNAAKVTMNQLKFYLMSEDDPEADMTMYNVFRKGELQMIDIVPPGQVSESDPELHVEGSIGTYYLCWNINRDLSPVGGSALTEEQQAEVRKALSLMLDRNAIIKNMGGMNGPAASYVGKGITESDGDQFYEKAGHSSEYIGYYPTDAAHIAENRANAMAIFKKYYSVSNGKIMDFPKLTYTYNTSGAHVNLANYLHDIWGSIGIDLTVEGLSWPDLMRTVKSGSFDVSRGGWIADFDDALNFLQNFTSTSNNNWSQLGVGSHGSDSNYRVDLSSEGYGILTGTWADTYDQLCSLILKTDGGAKRDSMLHKAEDLLMSTGCVCPIYYYNDVYMLSSDVSGFFTSPFGNKYFMYTSYH